MDSSNPIVAPIIAAGEPTLDVIVAATVAHLTKTLEVATTKITEAQTMAEAHSKTLSSVEPCLSRAEEIALETERELRRFDLHVVVDRAQYLTSSTESCFDKYCVQDAIEDKLSGIFS